MHTSFTTPDPVHLYVELGAGHLTVAAAEVDATTIDIHGPRAEEFKVEQAGRSVSVVAPRGRFFGHGDDHTVQITVPADSDLATKTGSADTETTGALGVVKLKSGSGNVEVELAERAAMIESGSGDIRGHELRGDVRIKSGSGDIDLGEVRGSTSISTGSGDVVIGLAHATTVVKSGSGDLEVKRSAADVSLSTASGDVTLGHVPGGRVTAKNVSGDVRVGIPEGTPVWTDVSSVTGNVASNLVSAGKPAEGQPYVELRATTVSGDVVLRQV
jgi:DUF4097 and DUF4098 domain-containing protein YvlB